MPRPRTFHGEDVHRIKNPGIARLAYKGGVHSLSERVYEDTRRSIMRFLEDIIKPTVLFVEHARRKTVGIQDVVNAMEFRGTKISSTGKEALMKRCRAYTKKSNRIQFAKQSGCFNLPKSVFADLVRIVGQEFRWDLRWSANAIALLQVITEAHVTSMFESAGKMARNAKRVRVVPGNMQGQRIKPFEIV